jgi:signal transduction histidine kinase
MAQSRTTASYMRSRTAGQFRHGCAVLVVLAFLLASVGHATEAASPKRVLLIHSFGRDFAPYDTIATVFRTELATRSTDPIVFFEANLDAARTLSENEEQAFFQYLGARFDGTAPDLVVTIGPPAARIYARHRESLFPNTPLVMAALDERLVPREALGPNDAVSAGRVDLPGLVENILQVLPDTNTIAVVIGHSELEQFWLIQVKRAFAPFEPRVRFEWLNELSLEKMQQRVAALPPHSAILYGILIVDAAGIPHERGEALTKLYAAANAPIFGIYESELGKGVVGGPYTSQRRHGEAMTDQALRALSSERSLEPRIAVTPVESPIYDWRELSRWSIDTARLPPGSAIRFKPPSLWVQHRETVVATLAVFLLQAAMIAALMWQRIRRRRAEREAQSLGGRLVSAHEDERRRLARELHDDVSQRLAGFAIEAAAVEKTASGSAAGDAVHAIRDGLVELSEDVHALSYRLHPSVIEDLGLVEALKVECDRIARQGPLQIALESGNAPKDVSADVALCVYRVAQEALRNVERHADASRVEVTVSSRSGGIALAVRDDGKGFDDSKSPGNGRLGLASMRERVRVLGGSLDIESSREGGTAILAWVPLREAA